MKTPICAIVLAFVVLISGCNNGGEKPALSQAEMVPVLYGLMLADEYAQQLEFKDSTKKAKNVRAEKYQQVFGLYKTDRKTFTASFQYYEGRPNELKTIFDSVDALAVRYRIQKFVTPTPKEK